MEASRISQEFLQDIEKDNYEDRKLARTLGSYKNYFKKLVDQGKQAPKELCQEVYLSHMLDQQIQTVESSIVSLMSYEDKPYL